MTTKKESKKKKLVLLDAHAIIHRAYHALPEFSSASGEPTGALYGLSAMLLKLIGDLKPDYLAACYDLPEPTYRHQVYDGYKAGRAKIDEALEVQLERSRDIFKVFNIPLYDHPGFEADDILGTIVEQMKQEKGLEIVIASGDMDTLQLVEGKRVRVYTLKRGLSDTVLYDEAAVQERFGFGPQLLPDFKGLRGDPSDNIIGIAGIGEKTATELIQKFGTIEAIYKKLKKSEKAFKSAGIKPRIVKLLSEGEEEALFSKMLASIRRDAPIVYTLPKERWEDTLDLAPVIELFSNLNFRTLSDRVRKMFGGTKTLLPDAQEEAAREEVSDDEIKKVGLALWVVNSDITNPGLDDILDYTGVKRFSEAKRIIFEKLKEENLERVYEEIELPLMPVVERMERCGIVLDIQYLKELSKKYHAELSKIEARIHTHADGAFNINSPRQLSEVLFEKLGLSAKNQKKTETGQKSTRESELEKMRDLHPIIGDILSYRELQKLLSTYIDNLPKMADSEGRLHAQFLQSGTTTGRMSSQNPNLQNIPIRTDLGRAIRNAFIASDGFSIVALDYSQIELRVAAFLSGDSKLIQIFKDGIDVHRAVAAEVFGVPPEMVDHEMRRRAKVINFGILYGMGVNALRQNLGTSRAEAQKYLNDYFKNFGGLSRYLTLVKADAERRGYTETLFGRRRHFEGIRSSLPQVKAQAERMAINAPIQGTQSDIIKIAMVRVSDYLTREKRDDDAHLLLQVHDELVYEIKTGDVSKIANEIKKIMESILTPKETAGIALITDVSAGPSWGEMKPL